MTVPTPTTFAQVPAGGVLSVDLSAWWMKTATAGTAVNLQDGTVADGWSDTQVCTYFPDASLSV